MKILSTILMISFLVQNCFADVIPFSVKLFKNKTEAEKEMNDLAAINVQSHLLTSKEVVLDSTEINGSLNIAGENKQDEPIYIVIGSNEVYNNLDEQKINSEVLKFKVFTYIYQAEEERDRLKQRYMNSVTLIVDANYFVFDSSNFGGEAEKIQIKRSDLKEYFKPLYVTIGTK